MLVGLLLYCMLHSLLRLVWGWFMLVIVASFNSVVIRCYVYVVLLLYGVLTSVLDFGVCCEFVVTDLLLTLFISVGGGYCCVLPVVGVGFDWLSGCYLGWGWVSVVWILVRYSGYAGVGWGDCCLCG